MTNLIAQWREFGEGKYHPSPEALRAIALKTANEIERFRGAMKAAAVTLAAESFAPRSVIVALLEPLGIDPGCPEHGVGSIRDAFDGCSCPGERRSANEPTCRCEDPETASRSGAAYCAKCGKSLPWSKGGPTSAH